MLDLLKVMLLILGSYIIFLVFYRYPKMILERYDVWLYFVLLLNSHGSAVFLIVHNKIAMRFTTDVAPFLALKILDVVNFEVF